MEAGETSLGGLEMREVMNCYLVAMKKQSSYLYLLMYVSALVYTVQSRQEMHTRDCVLVEAGETSLGGLEMRDVMNCYRDNCSELKMKLG